MTQPEDTSLESASAVLKDALKAIVRHVLSENLEALKQAGDLPDAEGMRALVREEVQGALGEVRVPTEDVIAEIARRESEGAASREELDTALQGMEERLQDRIRSVLEEKMAAFAESEKILHQIETKLEGLRTELDGVESQEEMIKEKLSFVFEGESFAKAVGDLVSDRIPTEEAIAEIAKGVQAEAPAPSVSQEAVEGIVMESLRGFTESLEARIREGVEAVVAEKGTGGGGDGAADVSGLVKDAVSEALAGEAFRKAVEAAVAEQAARLKPDVDSMAEPLAALASKTTEKILAREAEGLVRQIKIELGKVRTEMKKNMEQTVAFLRSPEMEKLIAEVAGKTSKAPDLEELKGAVEEIAAKAAEDGLKAMIEKLQAKVEESVDERLAKFIESDVLRESVAAVAAEVAPAGGGGGEGGGGGDPAAIRKIVADEIMRRTEEAFADLVPRHVGKFLDEKLPPPEYFQTLVTMNQVQQEIDKRVKGASSGSGSSRGMAAGGPGESAIFTNMIGRVLASDELKELIDDKFRVINTYIKNELVPKAVKKELEK